MERSRALLFILLLPSFVYAVTSFTPNCTLPASRVNYVAGPNTRGTLEILWSCLFTIVACTWTVLHLNIPEQREGRDRYPDGPWYMQWWGDFKWMIKGIWPTLKWMIITIFAPELILGLSWNQYIWARKSQRYLCDINRELDDPWTLTHIFYAQMGGFVLRVDEKVFSAFNLDELLHALGSQSPVGKGTPVAALPGRNSRVMSPIGTESFGRSERNLPSLDSFYSQSPDITQSAASGLHPENVGLPQFKFRHAEQQENSTDQPVTSRVDTRQINDSHMKLSPRLSFDGHEGPSKRGSQASAERIDTGIPQTNSDTKLEVGTAQHGTTQHDLYHLRGETVMVALEKGLIPKEPPVTKEELNDKSKSDGFGKTIAIAQISWFCINVITRGTRCMGISQLEIAVTAFSACSVITYLIQFSKPKGVVVPTTIKPADGCTMEEILKLQQHVHSTDSVRRGSVVGMFEHAVLFNSFYGLVGCLVGSVLFGAIHIAAWNFEYPTQFDKILWIVAAVTSTVFVPVSVVMAALVIVLPAFGSFLVRDWSDRWNGFDDTDDTWFVEVAVNILDAIPVIIVIPLVLCILARLVLIVEMFRCLFNLPPDAYTATWASNFPHIG